MGKLGFTFIKNRCIGCMACQMACKEWHGLGIGEALCTVDLHREGGQASFQFESCRHCDRPLCAAVCPTGAMFAGADGVVGVREELCIGCRKCIAACPFGHPILRKATKAAVKCDGCAQRRTQGLEPVCSAACPTRALSFGERGGHVDEP